MNPKSFYTLNILKTLLILITTSFIALAQKTDIITLVNGDKLTGELKELQTGLLELSTDNMGTVYIEWDKIAEIKTDKFFEIEVEDGRIYFGSLQPNDKPGTMIVKGVTLETVLILKYIIRIKQINESFWDILDGYIQLGVSFNKGSNVAELNFGADLIYTLKARRFELLLNSDISASEGNSTSKSQDASFTYYRYMKKKWFWGTLASINQNTELGLDLRGTLGATIGNDFIQSNKNLLNLAFGLTGSREWYTDETDPENDLAALISNRFKYFIYESPGIFLDSYLNFFPYLTNWGRIRLTYDLALDWEIINNFYWDLSFYLNYDNQPQSENASEVDYSIETGIKYTL